MNYINPKTTGITGGAASQVAGAAGLTGAKGPTGTSAIASIGASVQKLAGDFSGSMNTLAAIGDALLGNTAPTAAAISKYAEAAR